MMASDKQKNAAVPHVPGVQRNVGDVIRQPLGYHVVLVPHVTCTLPPAGASTDNYHWVGN